MPCLFISGQSKSQPLWFARKGANVNAMAPQPLGDLHGLEMTGQAKKRRPAEQGKTRSLQHGI